MRARRPKISRIKRGAVDHLGVPGFLQVALLHRRQRAVHHHDAGVERFDEAGDLLDLALAEIGRGTKRVEHDDAGLVDLKIDGPRKPHRLVEPCGWPSFGCAGARASPAASTGSITSARPVAAQAPSRRPRVRERLSRQRAYRGRGSNQTFSPAGASSAPSKSWTG